MKLLTPIMEIIVKSLRWSKSKTLFTLLGVPLCLLFGIAVSKTMHAADARKPSPPGATTTSIGNRQVALPSSQNSQAALAKAHKAAVSDESGNNQATVVPKLNVVAQHYWADGVSPALITISLEEVRGNERSVFKAPFELYFHLEPATSSFAPAIVKVPANESISESIKLTANKAQPIEISCTPDRRYDGIRLSPCQPVKLEFVAPIDAIGIEPVNADCHVNITKSFDIFLVNSNDPQTRQRPSADISIYLKSENENGDIDKTVTITKDEVHKVVSYIGTKLGHDVIMASATYEGIPISGKSNRTILFPWMTFLAGLVGVLVGAVVRVVIGDSSRKKQNFIESAAFGLAICIIVILFPTGTKLPELRQYVQPALLFALAILVGGLGPEFLKQLIALVPPRTTTQ